MVFLVYPVGKGGEENQFVPHGTMIRKLVSERFRQSKLKI
jgi:hypothetical protein